MVIKIHFQGGNEWPSPNVTVISSIIVETFNQKTNNVHLMVALEETSGSPYVSKINPLGTRQNFMASLSVVVKILQYGAK